MYLFSPNRQAKALLVEGHRSDLSSGRNMFRDPGALTRRHTDDRERMLVEKNSTANHAAVGQQSALLIRVAEP